MQSAVVVLVLVSAALVQAAPAMSKLPPWISACYRDDPEFDACAMKNGQACIKRLVQGERKLQLPVLEPFSISEMRVDKGANSLGLDVVLTDVKLLGLSEAELKKIHVDFKKNHIAYTVLVPHLQFLLTYDINGRILVLPITGHGPGNITLADVTIDYNVDFELVKQHGKDHMAVKNGKMTFEVTRAFMRLENLFNGDKVLGENMNLLMNEHWRILVTELEPVISEALGTVMTNIIGLLASHVPYDDLVPLKPKP